MTLSMRGCMLVGAALLLAPGLKLAYGAAVRSARTGGKPPAARAARRPAISTAAGDHTEGDDPLVRRISVEALGRQAGTVVVADTGSGRVLSIVNQKLALSSGYLPCSTIKLVAGLAALQEGIVKADTKVWFERYWFMTMTEGLAISNNVYFAHLGRKLGFDRLKRYAHRFGLGEKAGWDLPGEQLGVFTDTAFRGGMGRMTTFGDGISATPLQLTAFVSALANGGTLYYLQYPRNQEELAEFEPRIKRRLGIGKWIPGLEAGMGEAVKRGTGRKARAAGQRVWGKTGTCSQYDRRRRRTRLGWFASYNEMEGKKLAVVVMLNGGWSAGGPRAAEVAGDIYRGLSRHGYFSSSSSPVALAGSDCPECGGE